MHVAWVRRSNVACSLQLTPFLVARYPMMQLNLRARRSSLLGPVLAAAAILGWSSFAYSALTSGDRVSTLTAERDAALASNTRLLATAGELAQLEAKVGSARTEYDKIAQGWAETKAKSAVLQQELATLTKRLDQARDRVSQTGSIRKAEPPVRPAQKQ